MFMGHQWLYLEGVIRLYNFSVVNARFPFLLLIALCLTSYAGGRSSSNRPAPPESGSLVFIAGGGVKGPLAFASVELYALDSKFEQLYNAEVPIAIVATNAYAEITDLPVPPDIPPPYILIVDGTNAIDRNTGIAPVIKRLFTIITKEVLDSGKPVYATPYTTVAYHMLRLELERRPETKGAKLDATYFNDTTLSSVALQRVDRNVDFDWRRRPPDSAVNPDGFSVRWTGYVKPDYSEDYTFYTSTDDGVRLWIDGQLIILNSNSQGASNYLRVKSIRSPWNITREKGPQPLS